MRPVIDALRRRGDEVLVTARDFAQTLGLLERYRIDHTAIGHHRGGKLAAKGVGLSSAAAARSRAGRAAAGSISRSATAPTTSPSPPSCCGSRPSPPSTTSGRASSTTSTAGSRRGSSSRTRSRPSACTPTARPTPKLRRYEGLKEEYYLADFEPDPAVLAELGAGPRPADRGRAHAARGLALPPLRRARLHPGPAPARRASRSSCSRAPTRSARSSRSAGGFIVPEQAIDAPSLVAYADLVISAGGTMNREAVALGTPVWTTFEGRLGAVDERLIADGRMLRLTRAEDVVLKRREDGESTPPCACAATRNCSPICS